MSRKAVCSNCGKWFYNHNGMMIYLPPEYDDDMCPACNKKIDDEIKNPDLLPLASEGKGSV